VCDRKIYLYLLGSYYTGDDEHPGLPHALTLEHHKSDIAGAPLGRICHLYTVSFLAAVKNELN